MFITTLLVLSLELGISLFCYCDRALIPRVLQPSDRGLLCVVTGIAQQQVAKQVSGD